MAALLVSAPLSRMGSGAARALSVLLLLLLLPPLARAVALRGHPLAGGDEQAVGALAAWAVSPVAPVGRVMVADTSPSAKSHSLPVTFQ